MDSHISKSEIQEAIKDKDDFVKLNYLTRYLGKAENFETKKFILLNLAAINESRGMLREAIRNLNSAGDISITFRDKMDLYMKTAELYVKLCDFIMADKAFQKAASFGNNYEKEQMHSGYLEFYRMQGKFAKENGKIRKALQIYERLYSMPQSNEKKQEAKERLLEVYEKLGMMRECNRLKGQTQPQPF